MKEDKRINTIILYAPFGRNIKPEYIGGAEVGCLKTLEIYRHAGFRVIQREKPAKVEGKIIYLLKMAIVPLTIAATLSMHRRAALHVVGFYNKIATFENLLLKIGKLLGHKTIYELRNGSMITSYNEGGERYRDTLKELLTKPDVVLCQGMEYVNFIREKYGIERSFYPNYIMDEFIKPNNTHRGNGQLNLIYFGRVTKSKNVDVSIKVLKHLLDAGFDCKLDIVGKCDDDYLQLLNRLIADLGVANSVFMHGRKNFAEIATMLRNSHYFIFPSQERQEGHSNSLTEAMGCGVVPIVSDAGFNTSICGCPSLVVSRIEAKDYAEKIIEIENKNLWAKYSNQVYNRILENFTQSRVSKSLINTVTSLF